MRKSSCSGYLRLGASPRTSWLLRITLLMTAPDRTVGLPQCQMTPTPQQQAAIDGILLWLTDPTTQGEWAGLFGYAGTGKSYTVAALLAQLKQLKFKPIIATPTHKAARVLRSFLASRQLALPVITLAALLRQLPQVDDETGQQLFVSEADAGSVKYDLILIDEASMVRDSDIEALNFVLAKGCRVLAIGDQAQLPPVESSEPQDLSGAFRRVDRQWVLNEVIRYDGSILEIATAIRDAAKGLPNLAPPSLVAPASYSEFTTTTDPQVWLHAALDAFESLDYQQNQDHARILCWTNAARQYLNQQVRARIMGVEAQRFELGELLVCSSPLFDCDHAYGKEQRIVAHASTELRVIATPEALQNQRLVLPRQPLTATQLDRLRRKHKYPQSLLLEEEESWRCWQLKVRDQDGNPFELRVLHESEVDRFKYVQAWAKECRDWKQFYARQQSLITSELGYGYCLTIHRSQGSTFNNVFIASDWRFCKDEHLVNRLLYVAVTRAANQVTMLLPAHLAQPCPPEASLSADVSPHCSPEVDPITWTIFRDP
jgi:hypothetical protein